MIGGDWVIYIWSLQKCLVFSMVFYTFCCYLQWLKMLSKINFGCAIVSLFEIQWKRNKGMNDFIHLKYKQFRFFMPMVFVNQFKIHTKYSKLYVKTHPVHCDQSILETCEIFNKEILILFLHGMNITFLNCIQRSLKISFLNHD